MRKREVIEPRKKINEQMQMLSPKQHAISVISIRRDIMRNLSGSLGRGEFNIVMLYIPGRTYMLLITSDLIYQLLKQKRRRYECTRTW